MKIVWDHYLLLLLVSSLRFVSSEVSQVKRNFSENVDQSGTKWAVLVAGSREYENYRHQADVCHAYQILKKGGLKDENIIVFMYDDIAFNVENPRPGVIINRPNGPDVYEGVPKDYTGKHCTVENFYNVLLGNKSALTGGSGKVLSSGSKDTVFIYYADHGAAGQIEMPVGDPVYGTDLVDVLKKMHEAKAYSKMVIYMEACESGSMFEGLLPENISIFATTAANGKESSYAEYCESPLYDVCLGDLYSISWLEDSDQMDSRKETLKAQYEAVRRRTENSPYDHTPSHVMQFGNKKASKDFLVSFIGSDPSNENIDSFEPDHNSNISPSHRTTSVSQRDANLLHFHHKFLRAGSFSEKVKAQKLVNDEISERRRIDGIMVQIGKLLFGPNENISEVMNAVRPSGQPVVDDWDCFKMHVSTYEKYCGKLSTYGKKYTRAIANMCNAGITSGQLVNALTSACSN